VQESVFRRYLRGSRWEPAIVIRAPTAASVRSSRAGTRARNGDLCRSGASSELWCIV
jgi:hypothetical protein